MTKPSPGFEAESRIPATRKVSVRASPGRTGASQRNSSIPGAPSEEPPLNGPCWSSRMPSAAVCQPDPISRPAKVAFRGRLVEVEGLEIELPREAHDVVAGHGQRLADDHVADGEILERGVGHGGLVSWRQREH